MSGVSKEQVAKAREIDLLSYLQSCEPGELKPDGPGRYTTISHDSLVISRGKWVWNGGGVGGVSALDYLIKVRGMGFVEAVKRLTDSPRAFTVTPKAQSPPEPEKRRFYAPKPLRYANGAVSYLQRRGISPEVIARCMDAGILFESRYFNPQSSYHNAAVCVFAGKDAAGTVRFAALRGIDSDLKQDKAGSDKRFNFHLPAKNPASMELACFEAPIDALSHATLFPDWDGHRLSLGGTSPVALTAFLERNPHISAVTLCLDNDAAGRTATEKIQRLIAETPTFQHIRTYDRPPSEGKDYNDTLLQRAREPPSRPRNRAADFIL